MQPSRPSPFRTTNWESARSTAVASDPIRSTRPMKLRCRSRYSGAAATARPTVAPTFRSTTPAGRVDDDVGVDLVVVRGAGCVRVGSTYLGLVLKLLLGAGST